MNRRAEGAAGAEGAARRADIVMVERGLFESRAQAQAAIAAGMVSVDGIAIRKASVLVAANARIDARPAHPFVSRGGVKLADVLEQSGLSPKDRVCLDVGASTGGFTEVLLAQGARCVYAVDVGTGQLHARLRQDPSVVVMENTDIRKIAAFPDNTPDFAVIDVSFISLKHVIPATATLLARPADLVALVKPQFEVGRSALKKGIVRDENIQARAVEEIAALLSALGWQVTGRFPSPIAGGDGNREFFILAHHP